MPAETITAAILTDLIASGLTRLGSLVLNKGLRLKRVDLALKGISSTNEAVKTAISDLETVIASGEGGLTTSIHSFLSELRTTGLITAIAEQSVLGKRRETNWRSFSVLYRSMFPSATPHAEKLLYDKICICFETSLSSLLKDPALAALIGSMSKDIDARLDELTKTVELQLAKAGPFESFELLSGFLLKLSRSLTSLFRSVRIETNKGVKQVELDRIYVPSRLEQRTGVQLTPLFPGFEPIGKSSPSGPDDVSKLESSISFLELQSSFARIVVLGDPGGGKSTLCQYICYKLARSYVLAFQDSGTTRHIDPQSARIPIRVVLRNFEAARVKDSQLGLFDYIVREIRGITSCTEDEARYALEYCLSLGKAVLAFDGLDEILNTAVRRDFVTLATAFCEEYSLCPVIVTSRLKGYEEAPLPRGFDELILSGFNAEEVSTYVTKFLRVVAGIKTEEAASQAEKFVQQTERTARDLRSNPLMLGLMTFLFMNKGDVPTNRPEIYKECAELMFEKWDQNRNIRADIPGGFNMLDLFGLIAADIFGNPELEEGVSVKWIERRNRSYFRALFENEAKSNEAAKKVTSFITGRSWVMSEFGVDTYKFTHRTFLEYFFARHLDEHCETISEVVRVIIPRITTNQWDVISHLALQIKTHRNQRRTSQALTLLTLELNSDKSAVPELTLLAQFAAASLQYLLGSEMEVRKLTEAVYAAAMMAANAEDFTAPVAIIRSCLSCLADRRQFVNGILVDLLQRTIMSGTARVSAYICALLSRESVLYYRPIASAPIPLLPREISAAARKGLRSSVQGWSKGDPFWALVEFDWYQTDFALHFRSHGLGLLFSDRRIEWLDYRAFDPGVRLMQISNVHKPWDDLIRAIGQYARFDSPIPVEPNFPLVLSPMSYWIDMLNRKPDDSLFLRGILACLVIHVHCSEAYRDDRSDWPIKPLQSFSRKTARAPKRLQDMEAFIKAIDGLVAKLGTKAEPSFEFWNQHKAGNLALFVAPPRDVIVQENRTKR